MSDELVMLTTRDHPEADGRQPASGDEQWTVTLPLERDRQVIIRLGRKGRDTLFGMLIADCCDSGESEPEPARHSIDLLANDWANETEGAVHILLKRLEELEAVKRRLEGLVTWCKDPCPDCGGRLADHNGVSVICESCDYRLMSG